MTKKISMLVISLLAAAGIALFSCNETPAATATSENKPVKEIQFVNGITDTNKGMRKGVVTINGTVTGTAKGKLYLWETSGKVTELIDSTNLEAGQFNFKSQELESGIYMIGYNTNNMAAFIVSTTESTIDLQFKANKFEGNMSSATSKENQGWVKYSAQEPLLLKAIKDARVGAHKNPGMKGQFDQQAAIKEAELATLQHTMIQEYPGTFLAKIMTWKQEPNKTEMAKYFDNIDFTDESIIHTKVMSDRIETFMRSFSKGEESGFINCISTVAEKTKVNDRVLEFSLNQMLVGFYESNMENICMYIIDNYINGESCGDSDLSNVIKTTASSIKNLSVGNTPPNIQLATSTGSKFDLFKTSSANKYTLVMFWSSWCEHCKGEAPEVKACYDQWKAKGFEIVGVSLDKSKQAWTAAITERGFSFPQVCGMNEYQSPVAKDYRVSKTPTFYLLDANQKIVLKPKGIREVQAFLAQNLK
jgi:thiol-disulfide isomerase/thioredoxin